MNGILNLDKPPGLTSHDAVSATRRILNEKQIGHLGTLDPIATGVLPLAVGIATRLIEFASYSKEYLATCLLGKVTDSCDITGKILSEASVSGLSVERVREEVLKLKAITEQVPPMVSAVKIGGDKLYELARKGITVERKPRPVRIERMEVVGVELPRVCFRVFCSAGTYIRVLCQTLGEVLGTGGCMETLQRTQVGPFFLRDAHSLDGLKKKVDEGNLSNILLPSSILVQHLPELKLKGRILVDLCQGKKMNMPDYKPGLYRILNEPGLLCSIAEISAEGELKPKKVFGVEGIS
jgi:tRNA pseudouridine55 synthase